MGMKTLKYCYPLILFLFFTSGCMPGDTDRQNFATDKTMVAWVKLGDGMENGGTIMSLGDGYRYDAFGISEKGQWIIKCDASRVGTQISTFETELPKNQWFQIAAVYLGNQINLYQDGDLVVEYKVDAINLLDDDNHFVLFGIHDFGFEEFSYDLDDARVYPRALSVDEIKTLKPNTRGDIDPYAWWDFENEKYEEKEGVFVKHNAIEHKFPEVEDGKLLIRELEVLIASKAYYDETPKWPEETPNEWLTYHLVHPGPGIADPGDPNPAFFYNGRYHLHYIYQNQNGFNYAHVSSTDMVNWQWHPTVLSPPVTGHGMFSGTGFYTREGTPAMIYHGVSSGLNYIMQAEDANLDQWSDPVAIKPTDENGVFVDEVEYWDPDIWFRNDTYFALSGGGDPEMMKSKDLKNWEYVDKFLHEDFSEDLLGFSREEDISCANLFPIGAKWMLLCISHDLGCRYFIGDFMGDQFLPEFHARMNWRDTDWNNDQPELIYFAPESLLTPDGRRVMWAWIIDGGAPTGVQSLPRELELPSDGILRIKPLKELESLRYNPITRENILVRKDQILPFEKFDGNAYELKIKMVSPLPEEFGVEMLADKTGNNPMKITINKGKGHVLLGNNIVPFQLSDNEDLILRVFIDKDLVEVFFNDRQAAAFRHKIREDLNITFFTKDADLKIRNMNIWKMNSIYEGNLIFNP